ncbi:MAG: MSMEG_0569 family flavin-dependent oxidoreductase [Luteolibacter sp.]
MPFSDPQYISVVIIGGGQAGLSASFCLRRRGIDDHVIFEKNRIAHSWREERWDSFCLVTPNHQCRLPGHHYDGDDPEGFMRKDEIVEYMDRYVKKFRPPVLEGITVTSVSKSDGYFRVTTNRGTWYCDDVIVAIGGFHLPFVPPGAENIPKHIKQIHSVDYKRPSLIPEGETLIVGSGQSGVQIMEDLHLAGRKVHLCLGNATRSPRRYRGRDAATWLEEMGDYKTTFAEHPDQAQVLSRTNHYLTGRDGGHQTDLRQFALEGVKLYGLLDGIDAAKITVRQDIAEKLDTADQAYNHICHRIDEYIIASGIQAPEESHYTPVWVPEKEPTELNFATENITSIVWCIGFRPDFKFIKLPIFNMRGYPETDRGVTAIPGLYFLGLPWMHTLGSARFSGIAEDADYIAAQIAIGVENDLNPPGTTPSFLDPGHAVIS